MQGDGGKIIFFVIVHSFFRKKNYTNYLQEFLKDTLVGDFLECKTCVDRGNFLFPKQYTCCEP